MHTYYVLGEDTGRAAWLHPAVHTGIWQVSLDQGRHCFSDVKRMTKAFLQTQKTRSGPGTTWGPEQGSSSYQGWKWHPSGSCWWGWPSVSLSKQVCLALPMKCQLQHEKARKNADPMTTAWLPPWLWWMTIPVSSWAVRLIFLGGTRPEQ